MIVSNGATPEINIIDTRGHTYMIDEMTFRELLAWCKLYEIYNERMEVVHVGLSNQYHDNTVLISGHYKIPDPLEYETWVKPEWCYLPLMEIDK